MPTRYIRRRFLQTKTLLAAFDICCQYGLAYLHPRASKTAEALDVSKRTIQRLRLKALRGEISCQNCPNCERKKPIP